MRLARPAVRVLGAIVHDEQDWCGGHTLHQRVEHGLRLRVDPVQVLEHQEQRLHPTLADQQARHGIERALPSLRRLEPPERVLLGQRVEEPEQRRQQLVQRLVQRQQMPGDLGANRPDIVTLIDAEVRLEQLDHEKVADGAAVRERSGLQNPKSEDAVRMGQLVEEAGLPHARLAHDGDEADHRPAAPPPTPTAVARAPHRVRRIGSSRGARRPENGSSLGPLQSARTRRPARRAHGPGRGQATGPAGSSLPGEGCWR